jgi:hypothetical protein
MIDRMSRRRQTRKTARRWGLLLIAALLPALLAFPSAGSAEKLQFADVAAGHWAYEYISWASGNGIVDGYPDGLFRPEHPVTRTEFLAMLIRAFDPADFDENIEPGLSWDAPYHQYVSQMRWTYAGETETDPPRNPNGDVYATRGYVAELTAAANGRHLSRIDSVRYVLDAGFSLGKSAATVEGYEADDTLTRAEALTFIYRMKQKMDMLYRSPREETAYDPATAARSPAEVMPLQVQLSTDDMFRFSNIGLERPSAGYTVVTEPRYTVTGVVYDAIGDSLTLRLDVAGDKGFVPVTAVDAPMKDGKFKTDLNLAEPGLYRVTIESLSHVVNRQGFAILTWFYIRYEPEGASSGS